MPYPHFDLVQRAYDDLKREGLIGPRSSQDAVEQDKGLLTRRAAWYVNQQRDPTHGLLEKTEGNNSLGYSVDWILRQTDGVGWDIATDDGVNALPLNGDQHAPDPAYIPRWRPPTADLAQMPDGGTVPEPEPTPPADNQAILDAIAASETRICAHQTSETDRVLRRLEELRQEVIHFAEQAGRFLLFAWIRRRPEDPTP